MKIKASVLAFIVSVTVLGFLGSFFYTQSLGEPQDKAVAFVSIGLDQQVLTTEVSSYEILRATEHFSDIVLGWTVDPSFDIGYSFSGQRQEKQNLVFEVYGVDSTAPAEMLVAQVKIRLAEYNAVTHAGYVVALERYSLVEGERSDSRTIAGATLLAFIVSISGVILWDYASRY